MKIVLGMPGSGKSKKIIELAAKDVEENKKVVIFSNELTREQYITKMRDYSGKWDSNLISVSPLQRGKILHLMNLIIKGYEKEEFNSIYVDSIHNDLNLLDMIEKYTGISICVAIQSSRSNELLSKEKPLIVLEWEQFKEFQK